MNKYLIRTYGKGSAFSVKVLVKYSYKEITPDQVLYHGAEVFGYGKIKDDIFYQSTKDKDKVIEFEAENDDSAKLIAECME